MQVGEQNENDLFLWILFHICTTVGIPQTIIAWRGINERSQDEKIEALSREIEALKEQLIINL